MALKIDLYQGDCLEVMKDIPDESIDLTVTSPPYDNLRTYNNSLDDWNSEKWKSILSEIYRITAKGGVLVWVVGDATVKGSETGTSFKQALCAKEIGFNLHDTMIYQKDNPPPVGGANRYYQSFEYMFVFSKGSPKTFNPQMTKRRNKYNDKRTERVKSFIRNKDGKMEKSVVKLDHESPVKRKNIWKYVVGGGNSVPYGIEHPAVFPLKLVEDHVNSWSNEGDLVFDPFMGSGTTGIASSKNNRRFIGIERYESYFNIAKERIDNA